MVRPQQINYDAGKYEVDGSNAGFVFDTVLFLLLLLTKAFTSDIDITSISLTTSTSDSNFQ